MTQLPLRVHWRATPSAPSNHVEEVDFLVDGRLGWVERKAPYDYGDDGNWLVTSFLKPGVQHVFTVRATTIDGRTGSDTVRATVTAPPPPPPALAGTWQRTVTAADVQKWGDQAPPPGLWEFTFATEGLIGHDPQGGGGISDIVYLPGNRLELRPTLEHPPYPSPNNGGACGDVDPIAVWNYSVSSNGKLLTLHPAGGKDPCGARQAQLEGTLTRAPLDPKANQLAST